MATTKKKSNRSKAKPATKKTTKRAPDLSAALAALPASAAVKPPPIPVKQLVYEARHVATASAKHAAKLDAVEGWDTDHRKTLPARADALEAAEGAWLLARSEIGAAAVKKLRVEAEKLRSELVAAGRFFLRADAAAQSALDSIQEGSGLADLIGDLGELRLLCTANREALATAQIPGGIDAALQRTEELATALNEASSTEALDTTSKSAIAARNRAAALVVESLSEVRAAAKYALRADLAALQHYRGEYRVRKAAKSRAKKAAGTGGPTPGGGGDTPTG